MSNLFGPIKQSGFIVTSLDEALEYWTKNLRIGPFFRFDHVELDYFRYRGQESAVDLSIALAQSGDMQIELVQQHNNAPSPYLDFYNSQGPGLQHYSVWSSDYDNEMSRFSEEGVGLLAEGRLAGGVRFAYFEGGEDGQPVMEIADHTPATAALYQMISDAALQWDGSDSVRRLGV
tara:strand:+ start:1159 stop:1686 length:528 start_codon:yes stop_codon:yes gene_type:complete